MFNPPEKLLAPAPRNIASNEDFLHRTRLLLWTKPLVWPVVGGAIIFINYYQDHSRFQFSLIMFGIFIVIALVQFFIMYGRYQCLLALLNNGLLLNGIFQYSVKNFRNGVTEFEMVYQHPNGITYKGTVGLAYYIAVKYPLTNGNILPLLVDPQDPGKFTVYMPACALNIGKAKPFM